MWLKALVYYICLPFLYLVALLPFPLLYLKADAFYVLLYYVIGYRKKVVMENLRNSFPQKSEAELKALSKAFYRYLCSLFLEIFKTLTISKKRMLQRCVLDPSAKDLFDEYAKKDQSVIIVMGHWGNWEWAGNTFSLENKHQLYVIYHPLANPYFNQLIIRMRTRFGTKLIPMKETFRDMVRFRKDLNATAFIADQTPSAHNAYWTTFLHQDTPVFTGTGKIAKKMNLPVVYVSVERTGRGRYLIKAEELIREPSVLSEDEISEIHTKRLEKDIIRIPEIWLWSHRRWKHKRPIDGLG